jgi:adenylate cyclase
LLIDDEMENLNALRRALGDANSDWVIFTASGESEGVEILRQQFDKNEPIDVVLTDLVMDTEASGMSVLQKARKIDPLVMAILFTAKEKSLDRYAAFDYGAFDVVEKNIRGASASREIIIKTRAAINYSAWSKKINFMSRYFDPRVFDAIDRDPTLLEMANKTVTIVFWDVRGFSRLCESLKAHPALIAGFLKDYCETGARVIFRNGGVLDKFIGDGIMALFGVLGQAGSNGSTDAESAVQAARELRVEFEEVVSKWMKEWVLYVPDSIEVGLGCGIHTGDVLVGNVGTSFRDQFTALGPHVNFTSRIEGRSDGGQILLSQSTVARVATTVKTKQVGTINDIKNIPGTFKIFEVV